MNSLESFYEDFDPAYSDKILVISAESFRQQETPKSDGSQRTEAMKFIWRIEEAVAEEKYYHKNFKTNELLQGQLHRDFWRGFEW